MPDTDSENSEQERNVDVHTHAQAHEERKRADEGQSHEIRVVEISDNDNNDNNDNSNSNSESKNNQNILKNSNNDNSSSNSNNSSYNNSDFDIPCLVSEQGSSPTTDSKALFRRENGRQEERCSISIDRHIETLDIDSSSDIQQQEQQQQPQHQLTVLMIVVFAIGGGAGAANLYYNQPLLEAIGKTFGTEGSGMGIVTTFTQIGYALGLLFITPLGDILPRKPLILILCCTTSIILLGIGFANSKATLQSLSLLLGISTVIPQVFIPLAADLATPAKRGRVIGILFGGLLIGVLLARTIAGGIGGWLGWRAMFWIASVVMILLGILCFFLVPYIPATNNHKYHMLLWSLVMLIKEQRVLVQSSIIGGMNFASFSAFWTCLTFLLSSEPYNYSESIIGLFGLIGVAGALAAPAAGVIGDKFGPYFSIGVALALIVVSWVIVLVTQHLAAIVITAFLLDLGCQAVQVSNQARIYALVPGARSRLNCVYMVCYFIGGALGSGVSSVAYDHMGWRGACTTALSCIGVAILVYLCRRPKEGDPTR